MTDIITNGALADAGDVLTTAYAKTYLEQLRDYCAELPGGAATSELTIASGVITPTGFIHSVDTESDGATDNLDRLATTNTPEGRLCLIYPENGGRTVVVIDEAGGAGQIHTLDGENFSMDETDKFILLYRSGTDWYELTRGFGTSLDDFRTYLGLGDVATYDVGVAEDDICQFDGTGYPAADGSQITNLAPYMGEYILIQDQKSASNGGTFTSLAWQTRDLNTEVSDVGNNASVASNQITLAAGTYYIHATAPAQGVGSHQARLHETTSTLSDILGTSEHSDISDPCTTRSVIEGVFTITADNVTADQNIFEIQHRCAATMENAGYGSMCNFGVNDIYTTVELWRVDG